MAAIPIKLTTAINKILYTTLIDFITLILSSFYFGKNNDRSGKTCTECPACLRIGSRPVASSSAVSIEKQIPRAGTAWGSRMAGGHPTLAKVFGRRFIARGEFTTLGRFR
jgi:hypothetical protein